MKISCLFILCGSASTYTSTLEDEGVLQQYVELPFPHVDHGLLKLEKDYYGGEISIDIAECKINECKDLEKSANQSKPNQTNSCIYHCPPLSIENYLAFPNNLHNINHYLFKGKQTFQKDFRVLIAGGGTGMNTLYIAEQLNHTNSEIVYIDLSPKSTDIARLRAEYRHLNNIRFFNDKIENIPNLNLGKFDFIESTGVLHHTESPLFSLKVLKDSLKPGGGMSIFVYSTNTRKYVYLMQEIMKLMKDDSDGIFDELRNLKELRDVLPNIPLGKLTNQGSSLHDGGESDENLYDLYLHKRDVSFTLPQLLEWVTDAGLNLIDWSNPEAAWNIKTVVNPYSENDSLASFRKLMNKLNSDDKRAVADLMLSLPNHQFYLSTDQVVLCNKLQILCFHYQTISFTFQQIRMLKQVRTIWI
ncbi:uncharacterized protein LOC111704243 isoform X2 [Eurytemora carolleeae]|uniref:uncharacterized protein LOC111704243 isoform X2 n=1 Tax=Eurytemora carolleeae TaxID=1294199 RepID=UPI000C771404|nr:uncharacterized protein LOC111704243 isoform X2 [Eurytemora carolleeae]|eukprot:XP_023332195.1 uncharacterized protein LOC111704243 isoform X2 [Eurytemora affinis]